MKAKTDTRLFDAYIGTRIIAFRDTDDKEDFNSDREKIKVPFHVFVPNYDNKHSKLNSELVIRRDN